MFVYGGSDRYSKTFASFYKNKSIVHSYNFYVDMSGMKFNMYFNDSNSSIGEAYAMSDSDSGRLSFLYPFQILDVVIPTYKYAKSSVQGGVNQFSFPIFDSNQDMSLKLTIEEDIRGSAGRFINWLQHTVVHGGLHSTIPEMMLGDISVYLLDSKKNAISMWKFCSVYYLGYESLSLAYDSNDTIKYSVSFGCDVVEFYSGNYSYDEMPGYIEGRINRIKKLATKKW